MFKNYTPTDHSKGRKAKIKELPKRTLAPDEVICCIITIKEREGGSDVLTLLEAAICSVCRKEYFNNECKHVEGFIYKVNYESEQSETESRTESTRRTYTIKR